MELAVKQHAPQFETEATPDPDLLLVRASIAGDMAAFEEIVRRYDRKLLRMAQRITRNLEDAEEVVQEAFLKAYRKLDQFEGKSRFSTWLIRIAMNQCLMRLRDRRRLALEVPLEYEDDDRETLPLDVADWAPNPEQLYDRSELQQILSCALDSLSPALRIVFVLRDMEEFSIAETATILQLGQSAVKSRLLRARLELRERLSKYFRQPHATSPADSGQD